MNFFRVQHAGYSIDEMKHFSSADGGDGEDSEGSLCACQTVTELLNNTVWDAMSDHDEVVVFTGHKVCDIYDGVRVEPESEVARFTIMQFNAMVDDGTAYDYETL